MNSESSKTSDLRRLLLNLSDNTNLYSISNVQDYLEYIIKKHETTTHNPPIRIMINETENRILFEIKTNIISNV